MEWQRAHTLSPASVAWGGGRQGRAGRQAHRQAPCSPQAGSMKPQALCGSGTPIAAASGLLWSASELRNLPASNGAGTCRPAPPPLHPPPCSPTHAHSPPLPTPPARPLTWISMSAAWPCAPPSGWWIMMRLLGSE